MFKSIEYNGPSARAFHDSYILTDSRFQCNVQVHECAGYVTPAMAAVALIYHKRKLPVAINVALAYITYEKKFNPVLQWFEPDRLFIEKYYPSIEYDKKYYKCVLRRYAELKQGSYMRFIPL